MLSVSSGRRATSICLLAFCDLDMNMTASALPVVKPRLKVELLEGLGPQELGLVLKAARQHQYSAKTVMTRQGEPANRTVTIRTKPRFRHPRTGGTALLLSTTTELFITDLVSQHDPQGECPTCGPPPHAPSPYPSAPAC